MKIKMDHVSRTEGHMGFVSHIVDGRVEKAQLATQEGARLFEGILTGRRYYEVGEITQRICGVCPVIHGVTALKAVENALGVKVTPETVLLRKMILLGQTIQSHTLHLYFLSLPDFLDFQNDLKMVAKYPERSRQMLALRDFGNKLIALIGGRTVHPVSLKVGGFTKYPEPGVIRNFSKQVGKLLPIAKELASVFAQLSYPQFNRETEYLALQQKDEYAFYDGDLGSSVNKKIPAKKFLNDIRETQQPFNLVKSVDRRGQPFMVGALARLNLNHANLSEEAQAVLDLSPIKLPDYNPFHNVMAQAVEVVHCLEEVVRLAKLYSQAKNGRVAAAVKVRAGRGVGAGEAPRGTLYHEYTLDDRGAITACNIITPTAQFLFNIEKDLNEYLPRLKGKSLPDQKKEIRKMIRAYDPCISCATH